jgi:hypothetical protein
MLCFFLGSSPLVQQTQISLPPNRNNAPKYAPVLYGYICETECGNRRPDLAAIEPACRYRVLYALNDLRERCAGEERLHAEKVGVEEWGEEGLIYDDLCFKSANVKGLRVAK